MPRPRKPIVDWMDRVFTALTHDWQSGQELADQTGLTRDQVADAVRALREAYPDLPLVSRPHTGYRWSVDKDDASRFTLWRVRSAKTIMRRAWSGVIKPFLIISKAPSGQILFLEKQLDRWLDDLDVLVTGVEEAA